MGGEKLKLPQARLGVFFAALFVIAGFFNTTVPLSAQAQDPSLGSESAALDESAIILGEAPAAPVPGGASSVFVLLRMVLVLAVAALAIYGVVFFIKRLTRPRESRNPHLKVLARVPLSADSFAAVVSVGSKAWLVGGASGSVNLISEIDEIESVETMLLDDARRSAEAGVTRFDFRSLLRRFGGARRGGEAAVGEGTSAGDSDSSHIEALRKQRERLRGL